MTVNDMLRAVPKHCASWPKPAYVDEGRCGKTFLALRDFENHMTDESWQVQKGLEWAGYSLRGAGFADDGRDAVSIVDSECPSTVIVADKREWDATRSGAFDKNASFTGVPVISRRNDIFRLTIVKDAWFDHEWTHDAHCQIDPHAYLVYYDFDLIRKFRPWIRKEQMIRIYHSIDADAVHEVNYTAKQDKCLLSGAINQNIYPLRSRASIAHIAGKMPNVSSLDHPGYHNKKSHSAEYLKTLSGYKVALCTSSVFGCTLRKMIEATACGCVVITDLEEEYPGIDDNFIRVKRDISIKDLNKWIAIAIVGYDEEKQRHLAEAACRHYHYKRLYADLAYRIEQNRKEYTS
jgi:hypothetical protein